MQVRSGACARRFLGTGPFSSVWGVICQGAVSASPVGAPSPISNSGSSTRGQVRAVHPDDVFVAGSGASTASCLPLARFGALSKPCRATGTGNADGSRP